jgi:hypothetical protein
MPVQPNFALDLQVQTRHHPIFLIGRLRNLLWTFRKPTSSEVLLFLQRRSEKKADKETESKKEEI